MEFAPEQILGNYRIVRLLGQGGMGAVYEVEHVKLGVRYALKTYTLDHGEVELFRKRFLAEGKMLARLDHPNLVKVFDLDIDEATGTLYYVMNLVLYKDGETRTLDDIEPGGADEDLLFQWFSELCAALAYVHAMGIVHRDIKLNNILLTPDKHVVLSDFGISRVFDDRLRQNVGVSRTMVSGARTTGRLVVDTEGYMAPEVLRGEEATPAADVYALGVVFFKLLTGVWYDPCLATAKKGKTSVASVVSLLSEFEYRWKDVLPAMLDENGNRRPVDIADFPACLKATKVWKRPAARPVPWKRLLLCAGVLLALALVGVVGYLTVGRQNKTADVMDEDASAASAFAVPEKFR